MLFMERMKKLELLVLKRDMDAVMRYLGFAGCLQLIVEGGEQTAATPAEREITELRTKVEAIARFLDLPTGVKADTQRASRPREALRAAAEKMARETADIVAEESRLIQNRLNLKKSLEELSAFSELTVPFSELSNLAYLTFRLGAVPEEKLEELAGSLSDRAIIVALKKPGHIMAITARKGKWALDSELAKFNFVPLQLPADATGVPADVIKAVEQDLAQTEEALSRLEERKRILRQSQGEEVIDVLVDLDLAVTIDSVKQSFSSTGSVMRVSGWIPRRKFTEVAAELEKISQGRLALESWDPQELPEVRSGKVKVPVSVRHGRIVRSFERMVFSYSVPLYGTLDPTPFVAGMFVLLFAIMFGDVGQGFVGLLFGLLITSGRVKSFESYRQKHFGTVFIVVGFASMVTGLLYGSFFANEQVLVPVSRFITQLVTGQARGPHHLAQRVSEDHPVLRFHRGRRGSHQYNRPSHQPREPHRDAQVGGGNPQQDRAGRGNLLLVPAFHRRANDPGPRIQRRGPGHPGCPPGGPFSSASPSCGWQRASGRSSRTVCLPSSWKGSWRSSNRESITSPTRSPSCASPPLPLLTPCSAPLCFSLRTWWAVRQAGSFSVGSSSFLETQSSSFWKA